MLMFDTGCKKKYLRLFILSFFILFINFNSELYSSELAISALREGKKLVFIRHSLAPGNGDPDEITLDDCSTQRNLNLAGINQSKKIGFFFKKNKIKVEKVLSSEWCRCKDTAKYAFQKFQTYNALNSFYSSKFADKKKKQINELREFIKNWNGENNIIFVTHYVVILEILNTPTSSGEIVIFDKNLNIISKIETL